MEEITSRFVNQLKGLKKWPFPADYFVPQIARRAVKDELASRRHVPEPEEIPQITRYDD